MFAASKTDSASTGDYQISRSLRFNSADASNLNRTPATAANQQIWTFSIWLKRSAIGQNYEGIFSAGNGTDQIRFENNDVFRFGLNGSSSADFLTTQVFRDVSAWYHIIVAVDTTQATSTNRVKIYVNGTQITSFSTAIYPPQNYNTFFNNNTDHRIGVASTSSFYFNGYMTEFNWIGGQQLTPSSFGETNAQTGVWQPKAFSGGAYGTNGFYLNFSDNSNTTAATLGKDYSGNGNNWTPNNFSVSAGVGNDSMVDVPTPYGVDTGAGGTVRGNYATWNSVTPTPSVTFSDGNLKAVTASQNCAISTIGMASGKWYMEITVVATASINLGLANSAHALTSALSLSANAIGYNGNGSVYYNSTTPATYASYTTGDIIGIAFDADAGNVTFYKNGTLQGTPSVSLTNGPYFFAGSDGTGTAPTIAGNFGQRPFAYTAPSGFKALCTQNLPTPTIGATTATQASQYFTPVLYTGNGYPTAGTQSITTVGFQPDWVWIKNRSAAASHTLTDAVRGVNSQLFSNLTAAQEANTDDVTAFTSTGFNLGSGTTGVYPNVNTNGATYVAWNWKANGSGSTNTAGSITSTVSANTTSGFSIVTWTGNGSAGQTIGHGLGVAPSFYFIKQRNGSTYGWIAYHSALGANKYLLLNTTNAGTTDTDMWNNTSPTSSVFSLSGSGGNAPITNPNTGTMVAYCFTPIAGYSAFGSYTGNGSADGPFVFTGMRPAYLLVKNATSSGDWIVVDAKRNTYNMMDSGLQPNGAYAEASNQNYRFDFLSNGFKVRTTNLEANQSGNTIIFMAFAEAPQKFSLAR